MCHIFLQWATKTLPTMFLHADDVKMQSAKERKATDSHGLV